MNWDRSRSHQSKGADNGVFTCSSEIVVKKRGKNLAEIIKANEMSEMSENGGQKNGSCSSLLLSRTSIQ